MNLDQEFEAIADHCRELIEVVAEPLFWFKTADTTYAYFGSKLPRRRVLQHLEDFGVRLLEAGQEIPGDES